MDNTLHFFYLMTQASSSDVKHVWVRKMKEVIQESYLNSALPTLANVSLHESLPKSPMKVAKPGHHHRTSR